MFGLNDQNGIYGIQVFRQAKVYTLRAIGACLQLLPGNFLSIDIQQHAQTSIGNSVIIQIFERIGSAYSASLTIGFPVKIELNQQLRDHHLLYGDLLCKKRVLPLITHILAITA